MELKLANLDDSDDLRSLLRDNPMPGWVDITVEREPSYFDGVNVFSEDYPVIARRNSEAVGMYCASILNVYINGEDVLVGYLGGLRVASKFRRSIAVLKRGFASISQIVPRAQLLDTWFTTIASENDVARRLLEAHINGIPDYKFIGELVTLALPTSRGINHGLWVELDEKNTSDFLEFYKFEAVKYNFKPVITSAHLGPDKIGKTYIYVDNDGIAASITLWDQRRYKQIVANHYKFPLSWFLPLYNLYAKLADRIELPSRKSQLDQTWLAFFCVSERSKNISRLLIENALALCSTSVASIGVNASDELINTLADMKPMTFSLRLYQVSIGKTMSLDSRSLLPEAALL